MYNLSNPANYLSKQHDTPLVKELNRFRWDFNKISTDIRIAYKSHPNWKKFEDVLQKNHTNINNMIRDLNKFLFWDNSSVVVTELDKNFEFKFEKQEFVEFKKILMLTLKENGISNGLFARVIETFSILDDIYVRKDIWRKKKIKKFCWF